MNTTLAQRLACYGAIATVPSVAVGDIQVYDGPPIPLDGSSVDLSLRGLDFAMFNSIHTDRQSGWWGGATQCCGYYTSKYGDVFCTFYSQTQNFSAQSFVRLVVDCQSDLIGVKFRPFGAPVGGPGCGDSTELCFASIWSNQSCFGGQFGSTDNCDESRTYYLGFEVVQDFGDDFGFFQGWIRIDGPASDLKITRWAWEDSGGSIDVGEEPPPACPADLNGDGRVDGGDLGILLGGFGRKGCGAGDLNGDGRVDGADIGLMLGSWGDCS